MWFTRRTAPVPSPQQCGECSSKVRSEIIGPLLDRTIRGVVVMTLPFVGDGATNLDGFFIQRETGQNTTAASAVYPKVYPSKTRTHK